MLWVRSLLYNVWYYGWLILNLLYMWILLPLDRMVMQRAVRIVARGQLRALWPLARIRMEFRGLEKIPDTPVIARKSGAVSVDRDAGASALKGMVRDVAAAIGRGSQVIIFPEGTRMVPGTRRPYHPGVAALYNRSGVPVIPVALNSGAVWGRREFVRRPGTIVLEILDPMPEGLGRQEFMAELERRIETASDRLLAESGVAEAN